MVIDGSALPSASSKREIHWREPRVALVAVRASGQIEVSGTLEEKRTLVGSLGETDGLLAIRMLRYPSRPEVLWVDDVVALGRELA